MICRIVDLRCDVRIRRRNVKGIRRRRAAEYHAPGTLNLKVNVQLGRVAEVDLRSYGSNRNDRANALRRGKQARVAVDVHRLVGRIILIGHRAVLEIRDIAGRHLHDELTLSAAAVDLVRCRHAAERRADGERVDPGSADHLVGAGPAATKLLFPGPPNMSPPRLAVMVAPTMPAGSAGAVAAAISRVDQRLAGRVVTRDVAEMGLGLVDPVGGDEVAEVHRAAGQRAKAVPADQEHVGMRAVGRFVIPVAGVVSAR